MRRRLYRQDLAWAGFILVIAAALGVLQHWPLVRVSWEGGLEARLEQMRSQRRQLNFQGVRTVNLAQAYALFQQGRTLFIDARDADDYAELHIPGAINLSPQGLKQAGAGELAKIPKDREILVYCAQVSCDAALTVAEKLQAMGFTRVQAFMAGFRAWDEAGYPADTGK